MDNRPDGEKVAKELYAMAQRFEGSDPSGLLIKAGDFISFLESRLKVAEKALLKHGRHSFECGMQRKNCGCICGLDQALTAWKKTKGE